MMRTRTTSQWLLPMMVTMALSLAVNALAQSHDSATAPPAAGPQIAQPSDGGVNWKGVGAGAGAIVSNLVYVPAKLVYGILGGIAGGAGYALTGGNKQVANSIWRSSLGGDYVLTPDMMTGKKPIYFSGPSEAGGDATPSASGIPAAPTASSSAPTASSSAPAPGPGAKPATYPIDRGAGPVGAAGSTAPYAGVNAPYRGYKSSAPNQPPLPDTSIE